MEIEIRLTHPPYSVRVTKQGLRTLRGSILAQAVADDPDCKEITLENPVLKPKHLNLIKLMTEQGDLTKVSYGPPDPRDYDAAVYLNWMLLDVVCDGLIPQILIFAPYINIYKPETYGSLLPWAICQDYTSLAEHILNVTDSTPMDIQAAMVCAMYGQTHIFKRLLARGVDPKTAYMPESVLRIWSSGQPLGPDEFYAGEDHQAFRLAVGAYIGAYISGRKTDQMEGLIKLLLPEEGKVIQPAFELLCAHNCYSMVKIFLETTEVDPNIQVPSMDNDSETDFVPVLDWALGNEFFQLAKALVSSPRLQIREVHRKQILHFDLSAYSSARIGQLVQRLSETR
jgi:hypothetical protein